MLKIDRTETGETIGYGRIIFLLFGLATVAALFLRFPLVNYNLPVAAHVDERTVLAVLKRLHFESGNPRFFSYPSLYFYVTKVFVPWISAEQVMRWGRGLNLLYAGGLALTLFALTQYISRSRWTGLLAAVLSLASPILIDNAAYLSVDTLFVLLSMVALYCWVRFFSLPGQKMWCLAAITTGLAIAAKYNAILVLFSVIVIELAIGSRISEALGKQWLANSINRSWQRLLLLLALIAALTAGLLPDSFFELMLTAPEYVNSTVDAADFEFIHGLQSKFLLLSALPLIGLFLQWRYPGSLDRVFSMRLLATGLVIGVVFFLTSPYALLDWPLFVYDFGLELKKTSAGTGTGFWRLYFIWYWQLESVIVALFVLPGIWLAVRSRRHGSLLLLIYFAFVAFSIGTSTRGFERYLSPLIPVILLFGSMGLVGAILFFDARTRRSGPTLLLTILVTATVVFELSGKVMPVISREPDHMYEAFVHVRDNDAYPGQVFYTGFTPVSELVEIGYSAEEVSRSQLADAAAMEGLLAPGDLLMLDVRFDQLINDAYRPQLSLEWHADDAYELFIYRVVPGD